MISTLELVAALFSIGGALLVSSTKARWQCWGFKMWLVSNSAWTVYGLFAGDWYLAGTNFVFLAISISGIVGRRRAKA
jgi:hypothetical protein